MVIQAVAQLSSKLEQVSLITGIGMSLIGLNMMIGSTQKMVFARVHTNARQPLINDKTLPTWYSLTKLVAYIIPIALIM